MATRRKPKTSEIPVWVNKSGQEYGVEKATTLEYDLIISKNDFDAIVSDLGGWDRAQKKLKGMYKRVPDYDDDCCCC